MLNSTWTVPFSSQKHLRSRHDYNPQITGEEIKAQERFSLRLRALLRSAAELGWNLAPEVVPSVTALQRTHRFPLGHTASSKMNVPKDFWRLFRVTGMQRAWLLSDCMSFILGLHGKDQTPTTCQAFHPAAPFSSRTLLAVRLGALAIEVKTDCTLRRPQTSDRTIYTMRGWGFPDKSREE